MKIKFKPNFILIPLAVFLVSLVGSSFTSVGLAGWYQSINLPSWTPPGWLIGSVWTIIFILCAIAILWTWNKIHRGLNRNLIILLFLLNGLLNIIWSYLFFVQNTIGSAFIELIFLEATVLALALALWRYRWWVSALLWPYLGWVAFAGYLNFIIWRLNG